MRILELAANTESGVDAGLCKTRTPGPRGYAHRSFNGGSSGADIRSGDRSWPNMLASKVGDEVINGFFRSGEFGFQLFGNLPQRGGRAGDLQTQTGETNGSPCLARADSRKGLLRGAQTDECGAREMSEKAVVHCRGPEPAGRDEVELRPG